MATTAFASRIAIWRSDLSVAAGQVKLRTSPARVRNFTQRSAAVVGSVVLLAGCGRTSRLQGVCRPLESVRVGSSLEAVCYIGSSEPSSLINPAVFGLDKQSTLRERLLSLPSLRHDGDVFELKETRLEIECVHMPSPEQRCAWELRAYPDKQLLSSALTPPLADIRRELQNSFPGVSSARLTVSKGDAAVGPAIQIQFRSWKIDSFAWYDPMQTVGIELR